MSDLQNMTAYHLSNIIYHKLVDDGADRDYADQFSSYAEIQGKEYCLQMLKEMGVE